MGNNNTKSEALHSSADATHRLFEDWFDPIELGVRDRVRGFIEELIEAELEEVLSRPRYSRAAPTGAGNAPCGHRHGHRSRTVMGTFRRVEIDVPRARLKAGEGKTTEWRSTVAGAFVRAIATAMSATSFTTRPQMDSLIASLEGKNR